MTDNPSNAPISPSNMAAELAELARALTPARGPKLTFLDRCAAFACLYQGIPQPIVAKAFGISRASVSYIGGCVPIDNRPPVTIEIGGHVETLADINLTRRRLAGRKPRYQDVTDEFVRLGPDLFIQRYVTAELRDKLIRLRDQRPKPGDDRTPFGFDPTDHGFKGVHDFGVNGMGGDEIIRVALIRNVGWVYAGCTLEGKPLHDQWAWCYDDNGKPFRTDKAAFEHAKRDCSPDCRPREKTT